MKIENLRIEKIGSRKRSSATIIWEDCGRPSQDIFFDTTEEFARDFSCDPHSFVIACTIAGLHFGEERLSIKANICPELKNGLNTVMEWMKLWWFNRGKKIVRIEADTKPISNIQRTIDRAGFFFSGGIDSLATLRCNRAEYPIEHARSLKDGIIVCGLEVANEKEYDNVIKVTDILAKNENITIIPVYTNIRTLGPTDDMEFWGDFWVKEFMGAAFSSIAHCFSKRLTSVSISSDHDIPNIYPFSSHPLINPNYSSFEMQIKLEGITLSRFDKVKTVGHWELALQCMRVCNRTEYYNSQMLNCGECEKCIRTMLALMALGVLKKAKAFPINDVIPEQIEKIGPLRENTYFFWSQLIIPLKKINRYDLVRAVERKIAEYLKNKKKKELRNFLIEPIIKIDQDLFGGIMHKIKRMTNTRGIWN